MEVLRAYLSLLPSRAIFDDCVQIVYCCWLLFELAYVYIFIVETKGLSLEEMDEVFGSAGMAAGENARFIEIERRIGRDAYNDPDPNSAPSEKRDTDLIEKA